MLHAASDGDDPSVGSATFERVEIRSLDSDVANAAFVHWLREFDRGEVAKPDGDSDLISSVRFATALTGIDVEAMSVNGLSQRAVFLELATDTQTTTVGYLCRPECEYESPIVAIPLSSAAQ